MLRIPWGCPAKHRQLGDYADEKFRCAHQTKTGRRVQNPLRHAGLHLLYVDFFVEDADPWRPDAWAMMRQRATSSSYMITKRIDRLIQCLPADWGEGYEHVTICCTVENQSRADYRLPIYRSSPSGTKSSFEPVTGAHRSCTLQHSQWGDKGSPGGRIRRSPLQLRLGNGTRSVCEKERCIWFKTNRRQLHQRR